MEDQGSEQTSPPLELETKVRSETMGQEPQCKIPIARGESPRYEDDKEEIKLLVDLVSVLEFL